MRLALLLAFLAFAAPASASTDLSITPSESYTIESDRTEMVARTVTITNTGTEPIVDPATRIVRDAATGQPGTINCTPDCFQAGPDWTYSSGTLDPGDSYSFAYEFYPPSAMHPDAPAGGFRFEATGRRTAQDTIVPLTEDTTDDNVYEFNYQWLWKDARATLGPRWTEARPVQRSAPFSFEVPLGNVGPDPYRKPLRLGVWGADGAQITAVTVPGGQCQPGTSTDSGAAGIECVVTDLVPGAERPVSITAVTDTSSKVGVTLGIPGFGAVFGDVQSDGAYPFDDLSDHARAYSFCVPGECDEPEDPGDGGGTNTPPPVTQTPQTPSVPKPTPGIVVPGSTVKVTKRRFAIAYRCTTAADCASTRLRFSGGGIKFSARTPSVPAPAAVQLLVTMPKKAFKKLRRKRKAVKFTVTGPAPWPAAKLKLKAVK